MRVTGLQQKLTRLTIKLPTDLDGRSTDPNLTTYVVKLNTKVLTQINLFRSARGMPLGGPRATEYTVLNKTRLCCRQLLANGLGRVWRLCIAARPSRAIPCGSGSARGLPGAIISLGSLPFDKKPRATSWSAVLKLGILPAQLTNHEWAAIKPVLRNNRAVAADAFEAVP
jgi:hypothetical protein